MATNCDICLKAFTYIVHIAKSPEDDPVMFATT
jgi:hypothetical protein